MATPRTPDAEGLMTFLAVARLGRYTAAAQVLGVNHSTVSRRIAALEETMGGRVLTRASGGWAVTLLGQRAMAAAERIESELRGLVADDEAGLSGLVRIASPDAFTALYAAPALAPLQEANPELAFELLSATQRVRQHRSGVDIEIAVGKPDVRKALATPIFPYALALFATEAYLAAHGEPHTLAEMAGHRLIFYIESALQVDELDHALAELPPSPPSIRSNSVFAHLSAAAAGAGIAILPDYVAAREPALHRVLADEFHHPVEYWAVTREESLRNPAVAATFRALMDHREAWPSANAAGPMDWPPSRPGHDGLPWGGGGPPR